MARRSFLDPPKPRGLSLIEAMISLSLLLVGILGLMQLQIFGITSNQGARASGTAYELARELASALERLDPTRDDLLKPHVTSAAPPAGFGHPLDASGDLASTGWTDWNDTYLTGTTSAYPELKAVGVRPDTALEKDPLEPTKRNFRRRWSVWQLQSANQQSGVRLLAVSVVYRERTFTGRRIATVYVQVPNLGASTVNAAAYR